MPTRKRFNDTAQDFNRVVIVFRKMICHARFARVDIRAAQLFGSDILARGGFDQRRSAEENGARTFDDDGFIAHRRDVRAARRAGTHHRRDLRNALRRHSCLIVEDAPEVIDIGEDFILERQIRPARVDEIEAGQMIFFGDLLGTQMFLDRHREIRTAFDGGVVGDDEHFTIRDAPNAGDDARAGCFAFVKVMCRQRREFKEGRARVEQTFDAFAHE